MKTLTLCAGLLYALSANAGLVARATLIGQRVHRSFEGSALLICEYSGVGAKFEILSQNGKCAPYIKVQ
ncbi:MAG: hypothetical protein M3N97_05325 [Pseudomonadota bacterium]|nr:hypothetical protein [Pseudomonadota bacterium]